MIFEGEALLPPIRVLATQSLRRDDLFLDKQRLGLLAESMHVLDDEMVGEEDVFVDAMQPVRSLALSAVPERAEPRLGDDRMTRAEGDELAGGQSPMARERFEDVADVGVGDAQALRHELARKMRAAVVIGCLAPYAKK